MKLSALEHLVCLNCLATLSLGPGWKADLDSSNEVYTGTLECSSCKSSFAIVRGVPRMVDASRSSATDLHTGQAFAAAWKHFPYMDVRYRKQFFDWIFPVDEEFVRGKLVLECGCGKGRHAKLLSESGVHAVFAVDIGEAIDVAYSNVGHLSGVHLVQADIERLPFRDDFDFAFTVGVLHHMSSPISGFLAMSKKVNKTGSIVAWVYGRENNGWLVNIVNPIREKLTSKLPARLLLFLSALIAAPLLLYCRCVVTPWSRLHDKVKFLPSLYYSEYLTYISPFGFREIHHIVFDHLIAPVASYVARGYFASWFEKAGWNDPVIRWHNRNSWTGFSSRDAATVELMRLRVKHAARSEIGAETAREFNRSKIPEQQSHTPEAEK